MNKQYFHVKLLFPKFLGHSHTVSALNGGQCKHSYIYIYIKSVHLKGSTLFNGTGLVYYEKDERLNRVRGNILGLTL